MNPGDYTATERLVFVGFAVAFMLWAVLSVLVVLNRILHDRRSRRLAHIGHALADPTLEQLPPLDRAPAIRRILGRLSRRAVYRMVASTEYPFWVTEIFAAYSLDYLGLPRMLRDASSTTRLGKWRRISALFALGHMRSPGIHELLEQAVLEADAEVVGAAATILSRLGDRRAAEILVSALRVGRTSSRIATYLDKFPIPIHDLLVPLLSDERPQTRYWAVSLLTGSPDDETLTQQVALLADDPDAGVRKGALTTLGARSRGAAEPIARRHLADPIAFVRSAALRVLALVGEGELGERRGAIAGWMAPLLADPEWEVRYAAKAAIVSLGPARQ